MKMKFAFKDWLLEIIDQHDLRPLLPGLIE